MKRLLLFCVLLSACTGTERQCEQLCQKMVGTCAWQAWSSVEVCTQGCLDDLYRREDSAEIVACYDAAVEPMTRDAAEAAVTDALNAGLLADDSPDFSFLGEVQRLQDGSACDAFAVIRCKQGAAPSRPDLPLVD